jgi:DNA-binding transcriptional ArsR family regulator
MGRSSAGADVFHAVAEPHRRRILGMLRQGERPVAEIVARLRISQPLASKHLRVLRAVSLVEVRHQAQQRFYRLNAQALQPIHAWVGGFEAFWNQSLDRLDDSLRDLQTKAPQERP